MLNQSCTLAHSSKLSWQTWLLYCHALVCTVTRHVQKTYIHICSSSLFVLFCVEVILFSFLHTCGVLWLIGSLCAVITSPSWRPEWSLTAQALAAVTALAIAAAARSLWLHVTAHAVCCLLVSPAGSSYSCVVAAFTVQLNGGTQLLNLAAHFKCPACQLGTCILLSQSALDLGQHVSKAACVGNMCVCW